MCVGCIEWDSIGFKEQEHTVAGKNCISWTYTAFVGFRIPSCALMWYCRYLKVVEKENWGDSTFILDSSNWKRLGLVGRTNTAGKSLVFGSTWSREKRRMLIKRSKQEVNSKSLRSSMTCGKELNDASWNVCVHECRRVSADRNQDDSAPGIASQSFFDEEHKKIIPFKRFFKIYNFWSEQYRSHSSVENYTKTEGELISRATW